jgi:radical SAM-linked protein
MLKLRMKFEKNDLLKYISHLDMMRTFARAMRRANLPLSFSQGFTPRPRIVFASALPVGVTSSGEYMDVEFKEEIKPEEAACKLNGVLPRGLYIKKVNYTQGCPTLSSLNGALYLTDITLENDILKQILMDGISNLLAEKRIIVEKSVRGKTKQVDIAPLIYGIRLLSFTKGFAQLNMELSMGQEGNVTPQMVIMAFEKMLHQEVKISKVHREDMFIYKNGNKIFPL